MARLGVQVCVLVLIFTLTDGKIKKTPDVQVVCPFSGDCVLPCHFQPAPSYVVNWYKQEGFVLSSQRHPDQLQYGNRTSLFWDQISSGDASLTLRLCSSQDRGKYRCHVNTTLEEQESFVIVKVEAPVSLLTLEMTQPQLEAVNCSSQEIYPAPRLRWSTDPTLPTAALNPLTRITADSRGLYSVESILKRQGNLSDYTYVCTVNSTYGTQSWTTSLREREMKSAESVELTIPCLAPRGLQNFTLTWTFLRSEKTVVILTLNSQTSEISNSWENRAQVDPAGALSGNGSLLLRKPKRTEHTGIYTCTFTAFQTSHMIRTHVNITGERPSRLWIIAVILATLVLLIAALVACAKLKGIYSWSLMPAPDDRSGPAVGRESQAQVIEMGKRENETPSEPSHGGKPC